MLPKPTPNQTLPRLTTCRSIIVGRWPEGRWRSRRRVDAKQHSLSRSRSKNRSYRSTSSHMKQTRSRTDESRIGVAQADEALQMLRWKPVPPRVHLDLNLTAATRRLLPRPFDTLVPHAS